MIKSNFHIKFDIISRISCCTSHVKLNELIFEQNIKSNKSIQATSIYSSSEITKIPFILLIFVMINHLMLHDVSKLLPSRVVSLIPNTSQTLYTQLL